MFHHVFFFNHSGRVLTSQGGRPQTRARECISMRTRGDNRARKCRTLVQFFYVRPKGKTQTGRWWIAHRRFWIVRSVKWFIHQNIVLRVCLDRAESPLQTGRIQPYELPSNLNLRDVRAYQWGKECSLTASNDGEMEGEKKTIKMQPQPCAIVRVSRCSMLGSWRVNYTR